MTVEWQVVEGTGRVEIPGFGSLDLRRDDVDGGRQYFTAMVDNGEFARVKGESVTGGSETWYFVFDEPFFLADWAERCIEVSVSLLMGGRYAVRFRSANWPAPASGGGW